MGGTVVDCDEIYHRLLQTDASLLAAIGERFPGVVADGVLDRKKLGLYLDLVDQLSQKVAFYRLRCNMELEAAKVAFGAMSADRKDK